MRTPTGGPYSVLVGCNDNIISAYARSENGCGKCQFWGVKLGQDLENRAAHPHHEFPGIPLRGTISNGRFYIFVRGFRGRGGG